MDDQLTLDTGDAPTRARWYAVDTETGELSEPWRDVPAGCFWCDRGRGTGRLLPVVWLIGSRRWGGLTACPQHGTEELARVRGRIAGERAAVDAARATREAFTKSEPAG